MAGRCRRLHAGRLIAERARGDHEVVAEYAWTWRSTHAATSARSAGWATSSSPSSRTRHFTTEQLLLEPSGRLLSVERGDGVLHQRGQRDVGIGDDGRACERRYSRIGRRRAVEWRSRRDNALRQACRAACRKSVVFRCRGSDDGQHPRLLAAEESLMPDAPPARWLGEEDAGLDVLRRPRDQRDSPEDRVEGRVKSPTMVRSFCSIFFRPARVTPGSASHTVGPAAEPTGRDERRSAAARA